MTIKTFTPVKYEMVALKGGLDLVTPTLSLQPGVVRDGLNFECSVTGGYTRIAGYERYSGQPSPSSAVYSVLTLAFSSTPTLNVAISGVSSGATAVLIGVTSTQAVITKQVGDFILGETVQQGGTPFGVLSTIGGRVADVKVSATYTALAANYYRSLIAAPVGSGACRGVVSHNGSLYAFRNNVLGTAVDIWKASASGWVAVPLYYEVAFTAGGATEPAEGATLTKGGVTAVIKRVVRESGTWAANTAAGRLIIAAPAGGNFSAGAATCGAIGFTLAGAQTAITLLPGGRFEFVSYNFGGTVGATRIYGCDGINRAFEFDGLVLVPIRTGMATDTPKHIAAHKNYLFLSFQSSVQFSAIGEPYSWQVILGAGEFSAADEVTNFLILPGSQQGGALLVQTRNNTEILYESSSSTFNLVSYNVGVGALHYTAQNMAGAYALDDRGIVGLNTTLNYGNFDQASLTANIRPFIVTHRAYASAASVNREKSQYRVFFSDGYGLYATIVNDKYIGCMPVYFPNKVVCAWEGEDSLGGEVAYFGADNGMVYQFDKGTSFDGAKLISYITINFNAMQSPRLLKRYRKAALEITGDDYAEVNVAYTLGYANTDYMAQVEAAYSADMAQKSWDSGLTWDSGIVWDARSLIPIEVELNGTGENIAFTFGNSTDYSSTFTLNSLLVHYSLRRGLR